MRIQKRQLEDKFITVTSEKFLKALKLTIVMEVKNEPVPLAIMKKEN
jgi:hypothetical protein